MSSSSPTSSVSATSTAPLALTTPFVPPPGCSHFTPAGIDASTLSGSNGVPVSVLASSDDPSCYPSSWPDVVLASRLYLSPAVCPRGWIYNIMAEVSNDYSSAWCCQSGFTFVSFDYSELFESERTWNCGRLTTDTNTDVSTTLLLHKAWVIGWAASDTSTLSPQPPTLTNRMRVPTWTPGEVIPDGEYDRNRPGDGVNLHLPESLQYFLMIGLPIIGALLMSSCIFCCVRSCKKKRRARRAAIELATSGTPLNPS